MKTGTLSQRIVGDCCSDAEYQTCPKHGSLNAAVDAQLLPSQENHGHTRKHLEVKNSRIQAARELQARSDCTSLSLSTQALVRCIQRLQFRRDALFVVFPKNRHSGAVFFAIVPADVDRSKAEGSQGRMVEYTHISSCCQLQSHWI